MKDLVFIDVATAKSQTLELAGGLQRRRSVLLEDRIFVTDAKDHLRIAVKQPDGTYQWRRDRAQQAERSGSAHARHRC